MSHREPRKEGSESRENEPVWRRYLRFRGPDPAADLDDELRDHLDSSIEALMARGLSADEARAEALRRFGDLTSVRRDVRALDARHQRRGLRQAALDTLRFDLRYAVRGLRRSPVFTLVATISIALGVAANAAVFSVINAALLRPIPGTNAERLVRLYINHHSPFPWTELAWFRDRAESFEHVIGERYGTMALRAETAGEMERVRISWVTQGFFQALGVRMALGRAFDGDESAAGAAEPVAVLSHAYWRRRFGADSSIVGRTVTLAGHPVVVVGVAAQGFRSSVMGWTPEILLPAAAAPVLAGTRLEDFGGSLYATARLRPGVSREMAANELDVLMTQLAGTDPQRYERTTVRLDHVRGVNAELRGPVAAASVFLMVMVGLVLLIACANVANLLLARASARRTELGIRLAIGASRGRLIRQLLTESVVLAAIGAAAGFAAAFVLTRMLVAAIPPEAGLDRAFFAPDVRVLAFTGALCLATALLVGLVPALRAATPHVVPLLKADDVPHGRRRRRGGLVAAQAALCVVLLAVASLFLRSLASMRGLDPGFRAAGVVDITLDLGLLNADDDAERQMFERLLELSAELPNVESATLAAIVPLAGSNMETRVAPEGMTATSRFDYPSTYFNIVGPRYFETLRIPLRRGREFAASDGSFAPRVAVINEAAATRWWPDGDALGRRLRWGGADGPEIEIVGIVRNADYVMPGEDPKPTVWMPLAQQHRSEMVLQLRTAADLGTVRRATWEMLRTLAPTLPPPPVARMEDDLSMTLLPVRAGAALLGTFGMLALLLAAAGIYGVTAYSVTRRTREIGIRAALGADRARLLRMVLGESLRVVAAGSLVGLGLALGVALVLSRVLYGVRPLDPVVMPGVVVMIGLVALIASLAPARRASVIDPVRAMRAE